MLSTRAKGIKPSPTLALATKAKELKAAGHNVISLSVGEPDWDTFENVKAVAIEAIKNGDTKYAPSNGIPELRKAIADQTNADLSLNYSPDQVTVSTGGKFTIFAAMMALIDPGDEVIIPAPYWVSYPTIAEIAGGMPRVVVCDESVNFKLTPALLQEALNPKTKVLFLNSPSNPTGCMYSADELKALGDVLRDFPNVVVITDDIYNRLVFEDSGLAPHLLQVCPELQDRTLVLNGASKTYSMTGWRIGWALGPKELVSAMTKLQSQSVSCASPFSQRATVEAILNGQDELKASLKKLKTRRDFVVKNLGAVEGLELSSPDGAFYVWPSIKGLMGKSFNDKKITSSKGFCKALLEDQMVVTVPGVDFGLDGYIRISYALDEKRMGEAIDRIGKFVSKLS